MLLERVVDDVAAQGLGDRSLRDLAAAVGTSHRMLIYHFGSRVGLVTAIVEEVEARQRALMRELAAASPHADSADMVRAVWTQVTSPDVLPFVQLFFEAVAYAARAGELGLRWEATAPWLADATRAAATAGLQADDPVLRLGVAVIRGLLVDVITTGDVVPATAALERFLAMWAATDAATSRRG